jgi:hypothetical protein
VASGTPHAPAPVAGGKGPILDSLRLRNFHEVVRIGNYINTQSRVATSFFRSPVEKLPLKRKRRDSKTVFRSQFSDLLRNPHVGTFEPFFQRYLWLPLQYFFETRVV